MTHMQSNADLSTHFKLGMRKLASTVSLITTGREGKRGGLIATAVNSVSAEPPTLLVCVNTSASAHHLIEENQSFCVNLLPASYVHIAGQFSDSARRKERFQTDEWEELLSGAPVLSAALAAFDCNVVEQISYHSHSIFLGEIVAVKNSREPIDPLIYLSGSFTTIR